MTDNRRAMLVIGGLSALFLVSSVIIAVRSKGRNRAMLEATREAARDPHGEHRRRLKGGNLVMGRGTAPPEGPEHLARIDGFAIDLTEVTVAAYRRCVDDHACSAPASGPGCSVTLGDDTLPVTCVDWSQADQYCKYVSGRLPSEAEWELAARGTGGWPFVGGNRPPQPGDACFSRVAPCPVASHLGDRSSDGVFDLAGSVREWVAEPYCDYGAARCGGDRGHVARGGAFSDRDGAALAATVRAPADRPASDLGFRCAYAK
jgi:sulfatase modifying factor 1